MTTAPDITSPEGNDPLEVAVRELIGQSHRIEVQLRRRTKVGAVLGAGLVLVLVFFGGIALDNRQALRQTQANLCPIVSILLPSPGEPSPVGRTAQVEQRAIAGSERLQCPTR